jgi:hypothetical protein
MHKATLLLLGVAVGLLVGCGSSEPFPGRGPETINQPATAPVRSHWSSYLVVMTDKERTEFLAIEGDQSREQWLRRTGVDVRADLSGRLSRGISVESARRRIMDVPDQTHRDGRTTMLFYSRFNTESRTYFWLKFENDQLISWNSYTREQQDREREVLEFEQKLMRKFDATLERGMGINEINRQAANARTDLNRVQDTYRDTVSDSDYKGVYSKANTRSYLVAENLLYAQTRNELFEWFQGRQPDKVIIQRPFETHRYFSTYKDLRGRETVITVEFVFEDNQLLDWFVFHEN